MAKMYLRIFVLGCSFLAAFNNVSASELPDNQAQKVLHEPQDTYQAPELSSLSCLDINFTNRESSAGSNGLLSVLLDPRAPTNIVREISVSGYPSLGNWTLVAEVFEKLSGLQDVYWEGEKAIPKDILTSLEERNPSCRLHYNPSFNYWDPYDKDVPPIQVIAEEPQHQRRSNERKAILGSKSLHALKAEIEYGYHPNLEDLNLVFQTLATCPNLKELDLSITTAGCEVSSAAPSAFDFMSNPDVKFPPLESLRLSGYRFDERSDGGTDWQYKKPGPWKERLRWPWSVLPESFVDWLGEYQIRYSYRGVKPWDWPHRRESDGKTSLDCWLEVMDWSHLHTLNLRWPEDSTLARLSGEAVPNLKNITVIDGNLNAVVSFLANSSRPLESISLGDMGLLSLETLVDVISGYQSKDLKSLSIHQSEKEWLSNGKPVITLNATEISTLLKSLTKLQHLKIDVNRTETWKSSLYSIISSSTSVNSLTLHFPSPDLNLGMDASYYASQTRDLKDSDDEIDRFVNQTSVQSLFKYLREEKAGHPLRSLEVLVGNWGDRFQGGDMLERLRKRVARYTCEVDENGMEVCEGRQMRNVAY